MTEAASARPWLALVLTLFCAPLFIGLGAGDLQTDEAIYSFGVARILESDEWLIPASSPREDVPFLEKPPLKFWMVALPIRMGILPLDEFGLRFWDAVLGAVAFAYVFAIGRRLAGPLCGAVAVLILFGHGPLLFEHGLRSNNMEAALLLSYCGGVYHFLAWAAEDRHSRRRRHAVVLALLFVLGFMTKFVAVLFLPLVLGLAGSALPAVRARALRDWRMWLGAGLLALTLIAPWFLYARSQFGRQLWRVMAGEHVYTRFTSSLDESHLNPWYYYLSTAGLELHESHVLLPVIVLIGFMLLGVRGFRARSPEALGIFLWFAVPLSCISIGSSKIYHYAYPFLPPLALAAGHLVALLVQAARGPVNRLAALADASLLGFRSRLPAAMKGPVMTRVLLGAVVLAGAVSMSTAIFAGFRLRLGEFLVLRNSSVLRPGLAAVGLAVLANRAGLLIRVAGALMTLAILPVGAYERTLMELRAAPSPLRTMRDCLLQTREASRDAAASAALYVDAKDRLYHPINYYLRSVKPWQFAGRSPDVELYARLYGSDRGPALVAEHRYREFTGSLQARDSRAGSADGTGTASRVGRREAEPLMYKYADVLVVLPGRYAQCYPGVR